MKKRIKLTISGIVQGVGFRPFIDKLAHKYKLTGYVLNNSQGVVIDIEGTQCQIQDFEIKMVTSLPPLARIDTLQKEEFSLLHRNTFEIRESEKLSSQNAMLSPDIAFCDECRDDMDSQNSRYHNYFFTTCTNCGPRYSIIETVPYDRRNTSMKYFKMCDKCEDEYKDTLNRRYHAQPLSCHFCGPTLSLYTRDRKPVDTGENAIALLAKLIKQNHIAAIKGMGGFHIVCSATSAYVIKKLREKKNRPSKPFAVMFKDIKQVKMAADITPLEEKMITSKEKPIVLVKKAKYNRLKKSKFRVSDCAAPHTDRVGVFLPYTPIQYQLFKYLKHPIITTSANLSDEPIIKDSHQLIDKLGDMIDYYLDYNRDIVNACDDTVLQVVENKTIMMRLSRGFTPLSMKSPYPVKKAILAVGANQKNTIALAIGDQVILSPHIGDLNSMAAFEYFTRTIETFKKFYNFKPELIVCDKHPNYETTKWAHKQSCEVIEVQHHYAHILACMFEYKIEEKVLAFSWDGTGYGDDKSIWGGEVFIADQNSYERIYSLEPFKLLGGEKAVKEPKRIALSMLFDNYTLEEILTLDIPSTDAFTKIEIKTLYTMWKKSLNAPKTSSMGRVFDAVASLGDFIQTVYYDGESGLLLESNYDENIENHFVFELKNGYISLAPMIEMILDIFKMRSTKQKKQQMIASMFLNTLVEIIMTISNKNPDLPVVLSGGVFQNKTLLQNIMKRFDMKGRRYYFQEKTPINDGGIAFGQLLFGINNL